MGSQISGGGGSSSAVKIASTTLTDKTGVSGLSSFEQWGTEEAAVAQASAPASAKVLAVLTGSCRNLGTGTKGGEVKVQISLDGGSTWNDGTATYIEIHEGTGDVAYGVSAQHTHSGTVTGEIQARVLLQHFTTTTDPDWLRGTLAIVVTSA